MTEWQPIDTAPKKWNDEICILLFIPDYGVIEGWYFSSPKQIDDGWETIVGFIGDPTYWMPLPAPPKKGDE
jgi:hypothetical protein